MMSYFVDFSVAMPKFDLLIALEYQLMTFLCAEIQRLVFVTRTVA